MEMVTAMKWLRKRRTHRAYAPQMDSRLEAVYYPLGRPTYTTENADNEDSTKLMFLEFAECLFEKEDFVSIWFYCKRFEK